MADLPRTLAEQTRYPDDFKRQQEAEGKRWLALSPEALVGLAGSHGSDYVRAGAAAALQQQHTAALNASTEAASLHATRLEQLATETSTQTDRVITLTEQLRKLTVVIAWLTGATLVFAIIQSVPLIIDFVKWLRR